MSAAVKEAEEYARAWTLLEGARHLEGRDRSSWLEERCPTGTELRRLVEELLDHVEGAQTGPLSEKAIRGVRAGLERIADEPAAEARPWLPERIAGYRILGRIGAGGMGIVYEAEQDSPRRRIALKVVHPLSATSARLRRFRNEAQVLGRLQHPGIAQIHEAGTYDLGQGEQPFFAMEFVEGADLATHCKERALPVPARLRLLAEVCEAVQHAHEKGIVHRDLKPDNVLVDTSGRPKVLDFGIARAAEDSTVLTTMVTEEGELLGTIAYMAPEQLAGGGDAITPRADVHALGAVAYQLLTGRPPHDLVGLPLTAAINLVRDRDPERLRALRPELDRDLETIVGKALEKEPGRRYATAGGLAADLTAYLERRPISARPPTLVDRAVKFARRNKALVGGFAATTVTLLVGLVVAVVLRGRAEENALRAEEGEWRARAGIYQATQDALERGEVWEAAHFLDGNRPAKPGWAYRFLARVVPPLLPGGSWFDDRNIVTYRGGEPGITIVDPDGERPPRVILPDRVVDRTLLTCVTHGGPGWFLLRDPWEFVLVDLDTGEATTRVPHPDGAPAGDQMAIFEDAAGDLVLLLQQEDPGTWEVHRNGELALRIDLALDPKHPKPFVSPDGTRAAFLDGHAGTLQVRDLRDGTEIGSLSGLRLTSCSRLLWTPDGSRILTFDPRSHLVEIDAAAPRIVRTHAGFGLAECDGGTLSPDGRFFVADGPIGRPVRIWDLETDEVVHTLDIELMKGVGHRALISPDGTRVLVTCTDGGACVLRPGESMITGEEVGTALDPRVRTYSEHSRFLYGLALSPDGGTVATSSVHEDVIRVWDLETCETIALLPKPVCKDAGWDNRDGLLVFDRDGRRLYATARKDYDPPRLYVHDLLESSITVVGRPEGAGSTHTALLDQLLEQLGSPPPRRLGRKAVADRSGEVLVVDEASRPDIPEGRLWRKVRDANEEFSVAASPVADLYAVGTVRTARLCELRSGRILESFSGQGYGVDFSPDGKLLAVARGSGRIDVVDVKRRLQLLSFRAHDDYVFDVRWTPDGERLVSISGDATARVWDVRPPEARAEATRARLEREHALAALGEEELIRRFEAASTAAERGEVVRAALRRSRDAAVSK